MIGAEPLEIVLSWVVRVTAITGAALVVAPLLRNRSTQWRHLLWGATLISCLVPPLVDFPSAVAVHAAVDTDEPGAALLCFSLSVLYAIGVLVALCLSWRQVVAARTLRASADQPVSDALRNVLKRLATCLGISRPPELRVGDLSGGAILVGWKQPTILLPQRFLDGLSPSALSCVLGHELVHHRQRDAYWNVLRCLVCVVWWFHPLVWMVARRHLLAREECCDAIVVLQMQRSVQEYARSLVEAASLTTGHAPLPGIAFVGRGESALMQRLRRLPQHTLQAVGLRTKLMLVVITACLVLPTWISSQSVATAQDKSDQWNVLLHAMQARHTDGGNQTGPHSLRGHSHAGNAHPGHSHKRHSDSH